MLRAISAFIWQFGFEWLIWLSTAQLIMWPYLDALMTYAPPCLQTFPVTLSPRHHDFHRFSSCIKCPVCLLLLEHPSDPDIMRVYGSASVVCSTSLQCSYSTASHKSYLSLPSLHDPRSHGNQFKMAAREGKEGSRSLMEAFSIVTLGRREAGSS